MMPTPATANTTHRAVTLLLSPVAGVSGVVGFSGWVGWKGSPRLAGLHRRGGLLSAAAAALAVLVVVAQSGDGLAAGDHLAAIGAADTGGKAGLCAGGGYLRHLRGLAVWAQAVRVTEVTPDTSRFPAALPYWSALIP